MKAEGVEPGLCGRCVHAERITSSKGSEFYLCRLSFTDPRFPRYPPLPVVQCAGFALTGDQEVKRSIED